MLLIGVSAFAFAPPSTNPGISWVPPTIDHTLTPGSVYTTNNVYNAPLPLDANGYPTFVTILGESLEKSRAQYAAMSYPVEELPKPVGGRFPVYVCSHPMLLN